MGQIARAACIDRLEEIVVFSDGTGSKMDFGKQPGFTSLNLMRKILTSSVRSTSASGSSPSRTTSSSRGC